MDLFQSKIQLEWALVLSYLAAMDWTSVARWSRPNSTEKCVEKAPFTVILAIVNVVEWCNKA